jgi:hypothetical protein
VPRRPEEVAETDPADERHSAGKQEHADAAERQYCEHRAKQEDTAHNGIPAFDETICPAHYEISAFHTVTALAPASPSKIFLS